MRAKRTRRAGLGCGTALFMGAVIFLCVSLVSAAVFALSANHSSSISASFIPRQPGAVRWDGHDRLTMLLMMSAGSSQANIAMVMSFDPTSRSLRLLSLPGNLWVTIPGNDQGQLSQVYADGGPHLALLVAQSVLHVPIPYYAFVDARALSRLIDALGGVALPGSAPASGKGRGSDRLSGAAALAYLHFNGGTNADEMARMQRSQRLVVAMQRAALQPSVIFQIPTIVNSLGGSIPTNFPYDQVPDLAHSLLVLPSSHIQTDQLGFANNTVTDYVGDSQHVLLPDRQHIRVLAQREVGDPHLRTTVSVRVLNGAGISGQASNLALWLRESGLRVDGYASAGSFGYAHTQVVLAPHASSAAERTASAVATFLQVPLVTGSVQTGGALVSVIIGRDFLDPTQQ